MNESFEEYLKPQAPASAKFLYRTLFLNSSNKITRTMGEEEHLPIPVECEVYTKKGKRQVSIKR